MFDRASIQEKYNLWWKSFVIWVETGNWSVIDLQSTK